MKYENSKKYKKDRDRLLKKTSAVVQDLLNLISIYIKQTNDINQIISSNNKSKSSVLTAFIAINTVIIKLLDIYINPLKIENFKLPKITLTIMKLIQNYPMKIWKS